MITKHIDIDNNKWGILLIYDFDMSNWEELGAIMQSFGLSERNINKSFRVLSTYNSGMTISREDLRMSVVFIGNASEKAQFWNTIVHEVSHVANAITDYFGVPNNGEDMAYLQGYIFQSIVEEIAEPCK